MKSYYVYILTNWKNTVLYTGVTGNLEIRIYQHKHKLIDGFSKKYNLNKVIFIQEFYNVYEAIKSEKIIKGWSRSKKKDLVQLMNPEWLDLSIGVQDPS